MEESSLFVRLVEWLSNPFSGTKKNETYSVEDEYGTVWVSVPQDGNGTEKKEDRSFFSTFFQSSSLSKSGPEGSGTASKIEPHLSTAGNEELIEKINSNIAAMKNREVHFRFEIQKIEREMKCIALKNQDSKGKRRVRTTISESDRAHIKSLMGKQKMLSHQLDMVSKMRTTLENQMYTIENTAIQKSTSEMLKETNAAMKSMLKQMKPTQVEKTVEAVQELGDQADEISSILSAGSSTAFFVAEDDIDSMLESMVGGGVEEWDDDCIASESETEFSESEREHAPDSAMESPTLTIVKKSMPDVPKQPLPTPAMMEKRLTEDQLVDRDLDNLGRMLFS